MSQPGLGSAEESRARLKKLLRLRMGATGNWFPLSHGQEALWFLHKLAPESPAYNIVLPVGIRGNLDTAVLERSIRVLAGRHSCLSTEFREEAGKPQQRASKESSPKLESVDALDWSRGQLNQAIRQEALRPFQLENSAAPRFLLFRRGSQSHVLLLVVHHILSDLWSVIILFDELRVVYMAEKRGAAASLPPLSVEYEDYVRWQRRMIEGDAGESLWKFWSEELSGDIPALDLPTDHSRPPMQRFRGGTVFVQYDARLTAALKELAVQENATLYMVLLTAYQILLSKYSGQDRFFVGTPTAGRQRSEFEGILGDFVNMVPLRADLADAPAFRQLLEQTRQRVLDAMRNQDFPFSLMVDRLGRGRDLSRTPVFQTTFVLQQFHRYKEFGRTVLPADDEPSVPFGDLVFQPIALAQQDGQFDLNLEMKEDDQGRLLGAWKYSTDLFESHTIERIAATFRTLLEDVAQHPEKRVSEFRLLSDAEIQSAIASSAGPSVPLPRATSICELFEEQAARTPGAVAVTCDGVALTYSELEQRARTLAAGLRELGAQRDALVAVLLPRGLDFIATLLAVHWAGAAFLPIDPRHPLSRAAQIIDSSESVSVVTTPALRENLAGAVSRANVVAVTDVASESAGCIRAAIGSGDLAYVMYTSGSTGAPKGVMVEHLGMVNHVLAKLSDLGMGPGDVLAQNGPQSFDIVVWQCLAPLIQGGRVAVFPDEVAEDPAALILELERQGITVLQVVPSMLNALLEEIEARKEKPPLRALRWMVPTGEALPTSLCRRWLEHYPHIPLLNTYGSTECSDDQCHYPIEQLEPADESVAVASIGTPIHNMKALVLDENMVPAPVGVVGELYIGGIGVGRGYRGDHERTAAAFIPDPFSARSGARLYRTRDLARRREDGKLDFLGRIDHMIKLRGFRIEPKEIEAVLCRHASISEAAVVTREHPSGDRRLVAYYITGSRTADGDGPEIEDLRQFVSAGLPQYMVPATFCRLDALPLTANGKLDHKRLPVPGWQSAGPAAYRPPRTPSETTLAAIWAEVLGVNQIGIDQDFFAAGGDSILTIQVVARSRRAGLELTATDVFTQKTISALAALADRNRAATPPPERAMAAAPSSEIAPELLQHAFGQVEFEGD